MWYAGVQSCYLSLVRGNLINIFVLIYLYTYRSIVTESRTHFIIRIHIYL